MARGGVTYSDISEAAESIKEAGQNPTVDRVLNHLGTGSKSTIAPHLKNWKQQQLEQNDVSDLSPTLLKVVRDLNHRLVSEAEQKVIEVEKKSSSLEIKHSKEVNSLSAEINSLSKIVDNLNNDKAIQNEKQEKLNTELSDAKLQIIKLNEQEKANRQIILEVSKSKKELANQLKMAHEQNEHYQRKSAEERNIERTENRAILEQLKTQINEQAILLKSANERENRKNEEASKQSKKIQEIEDSLRDLQCDNIAKVAEIASLKKCTGQQAAKIQEITELNKELTSNNLSLSNQLAAETSKCNQLDEQISASLKELGNLRDRLEQKAEEYTISSQENAYLKSTLKQVQSDL